jgi:hypothetical protein
MFVAGRVPERYDQADKILMRLRKKWLEEGRPDMRRCLMCFAPVHAGTCLCTGSEQRAVTPPWTRCNCGCEQADVAYQLATDQRRCPGCSATRMSATAPCACGHGRPVRQPGSYRLLRPQPVTSSRAPGGTLTWQEAYRLLAATFPEPADD